MPLKSKGVLNLCLEANFETSLEERYSILHKNPLFKVIATVTCHFKAEMEALLLLGRFFLFRLSTMLPLNNRLQIVLLLKPTEITSALFNLKVRICYTYWFKDALQCQEASRVNQAAPGACWVCGRTRSSQFLKLSGFLEPWKPYRIGKFTKGYGYISSLSEVAWDEDASQGKKINIQDELSPG